MKRILGCIFLVLSVIAALALVSCSDEEPTEVNLIIDHSSLSLTVGDTYVLSASIIPTPEGDNPPSISWKSSDESIVSCENGRLTARAHGKTTVIASVEDGPYAVCGIEVADKAPSLYLVEGEQITLDEPVISANFENAEYMSADAAVATVEQGEGDITVSAVTPGKSSLMIKSGESLVAYRRIIVLPNDNLGVAFDYDELPIRVSYDNGRCTTEAEIYDIVIERDAAREYLDVGKVYVTVTLKFRKISDSEGADGENPAVFGFEIYSGEKDGAQLTEKLSTGFGIADGTSKEYTCALLALLDVGDGERSFSFLITDLSVGGNQ